MHPWLGGRNVEVYIKLWLLTTEEEEEDEYNGIEIK